MEYAIGYIAIAFIIQAIAAIRAPHNDAQTVFVASWFWIVILPLVAGSFALDAVGWKFDMMRSPKWVGFRRSPNPQITGYAVSLLKFEFQLFKVKA
jgi:hypothetical protein